MKKKFIFLTTLSLFFCTLLCFFNHQNEKKLSQTEMEKRLEEQSAFFKWYDDYKYYIVQLDFNWTEYHHILKSFSNEDIDSYDAIMRLERLAENEKILLAEISELEIPSFFSKELFSLSNTLHKKLIRFAQQENKAITRCLKLLTDEDSEEISDEILSRKCNEICVFEAPTMLFISKDIYAIREYFEQIYTTKNN